MKLFPKFWLAVLIANLSFYTSHAQKQGNIWYFGDHAGMDFNGGAPVVLTNSVMYAFETCGSVSDAGGNLMFYTEGVTVYNSNHAVMSNGTGLMGGSGSSSQGSLILAMPGSATSYYIFTIVDGGSGATSYSIVDMTMAGGLGAVTVKNTIMLASNATEKQAAVQQANGTDYWVIQHVMNSNEFYSFPVTNAGVGAPVISNAGTSNTGVDYGGNMKASPFSNKIACSLHGDNAFELYDFDNSTGIVSNALFLGSSYPSAYGVCFSPGGTKLYGSNEGGGAITQWDLSAGSSAAILASATTIAGSGANGGAMQYGPDGKLYIARYGVTDLDVINFPDSLGASCNFVSNSFNLGGNQSRYGLPLYVSNIFTSAFIYHNTCIGDTTTFTLNNFATMLGSQWDFGDTASGINNYSTLFSPVHIFTSPGTYTVQVIEYFAASTDTLKMILSIHPLPVVNLGSDTTFCTGTSYLLNAGTGFFSYLWQNGVTTSSLAATIAGTYIVTVSDSLCSGRDTVILNVNPCIIPIVSLSSSDTSFCEKHCINFFDLSTNSPTSWQWFFRVPIV